MLYSKVQQSPGVEMNWEHLDPWEDASLRQVESIRDGSIVRSQDAFTFQVSPSPCVCIPKGAVQRCARARCVESSGPEAVRGQADAQLLPQQHAVAAPRLHKRTDVRLTFSLQKSPRQRSIRSSPAADPHLYGHASNAGFSSGTSRIHMYLQPREREWKQNHAADQNKAFQRRARRAGVQPPSACVRESVRGAFSDIKNDKSRCFLSPHRVRLPREAGGDADAEGRSSSRGGGNFQRCVAVCGSGGGRRCGAALTLRRRRPPAANRRKLPDSRVKFVLRPLAPPVVSWFRSRPDGWSRRPEDSELIRWDLTWSARKLPHGEADL